MKSWGKYSRVKHLLRNCCLLVLLIGGLYFTSFSAERDDDVLVSLPDREIKKSEFLYFFSKNGTGSNIDLFYNQFVNMHLKLAQARQENLDRNVEFINELTKFRINLASSYLTNKLCEEEFAREAYENLKYEIHASHILIKITDGDTLSAYNKAILLREKVIEGEGFGRIAKNSSDDPNAKINSGNLGYFGAFQSEYLFEKAVFKMNSGDLSMPVRSSMGYHIIRCHDKKENESFRDTGPSFDKMKHKLIEWIKKPNDPRSKIIREKFANNLKKEWNFIEHQACTEIITTLREQTFSGGELTNPGIINPTCILCFIDGKKLIAEDLLSFISDKDTSSCNYPVKLNVSALYDEFISDRLITYENYKLEDKYPDFRYQLWEYRDAILLQRITNQKVWLKSISDIIGLKEFYNSNIEEYNKAHLQTVSCEIPDTVLSDYQDHLMKKWIEELHRKYKFKTNKDILASIRESLTN